MRAHEFIVEYSREKTAANIGNKIIDVFINTPSRYYPTLDMENIGTIFDMAKNPDNYYNNKTVVMSINGKNYNVSKENAPELAQQMMPEVLNMVFAFIENKDPTRNKQYTQWLARMYANGDVKLEDLNRGNLIGLYDLGKKRKIVKSEDADINRFKTYKKFEDMFIGNYDIDAIENQTKNIERGDYEEIYKDANVRVFVPHDEQAACFLGQGTRWCTAATRGDNMFYHYAKSGTLYILIPTKAEYAGEKYQLHFENEQFMDEKDESVVIGDILTERFPNLDEFFKTRVPSIKDWLVFEDDDLIEQIISEIVELVSIETKQLLNSEKYSNIQDDYKEDVYDRIIDKINITPKMVKRNYISSTNDITDLPYLFVEIIRDYHYQMMQQRPTEYDFLNLLVTIKDYVYKKIYIDYENQKDGSIKYFASILNQEV